MSGTKIYGYCRISTAKQSIDRQVRNILEAYPDAHIVQEVFSGTKSDERKEFSKMIAIVKKNPKEHTIVFDEVSRMSRDAKKGFELYQELFQLGVNLVFLKEPHINTSVYRDTQRSQIKMTGHDIADIYIKATNDVLMLLAKQQIQIAFAQAQKEVDYLHKRTREGIQTARLNGKQIGLPKGTKLETKKSIKAKEQIRKYNKTFGGTLNNKETWTLIGITKPTFYKYKNEILTAVQQD